MASLWILPVLAGLSMVRSESCSDALYCMHHIDGVRVDIKKEDLFSICSKTMKLIMCVEASIKDCHMKDIEIPPDNMVQLSNSILQAKNIYNGYCQDVTPDPNIQREVVEREPFQTVPADASCSDISLCILDMSAYTNAVHNRRSQDACRLITPSVQCLQSAVLDCERNQQMSDSMLGSFKKSLLDSRSKLQQFCAQSDEEVVDSPGGRETMTVGSPGGSANTLRADKNYCLMGFLISLFVLFCYRSRYRRLKFIGFIGQAINM